jgi:multisubunit Na+/H+ antiporter MnhB subunit
MNKVIGYVVSGAGILIMALGFGMLPIKIKILEGVAANIIAGAGIGLVVVGVLLSMNKGGGKKKGKGGHDEVPIYEGVGKKRRIVGYRKG